MNAIAPQYMSPELVEGCWPGGTKSLCGEVLGGWPAERVEAFVELFIEFNTAVEERLRTPVAPPQRENA